jgi:hypothetical protein
MELRPANELAAVRATTIGLGKQMHETFDRGRVCAREGCGTQLSVYNRSLLCWLHEDAKPFVLRVRNGEANGTAA